MTKSSTVQHFVGLIILTCAAYAAATEPDRSDSQLVSPAQQQEADGSSRQGLEELKATGLQRSSYLKQLPRSVGTESPQPQLATFRKDIAPILSKACVQCHGPDAQEGNVQIDTLDPDLLRGDDVNWWLEVLAVLSNGEMPPPGEGELSNDDRSRIIEWLSSEIQVASNVRRTERGHSSFRRMTRYEFNYALQDLLGLPYDFASDLPPESVSEDGFQNSSEMLQMSVSQLGYYRDISRKALLRATVRGEQPAPVYWNVSMQDAAARMWSKHDRELEEIKTRYKDDPVKLAKELERRTSRLQATPRGTYFRNLNTGQAGQASWNYRGARYAWAPSSDRLDMPAFSESVAVIPARQKLIVELGNSVPDSGMLRVRIRACRTTIDEDRIPSLNLEFGWQASNNSHASVRISGADVAIDAPPDKPRIYQWDIPLGEIYPRNPMRRTAEMGATPSPSEYLKLQNSSISQADIQVDFVEVIAPAYEQWPPESHTRIFIDSKNRSDEAKYAREVLQRFMSRAWRRDVTDSEIDQKMELFHRIRPACEDAQEAIVEVLATVLSSSRFLYLIQADPQSDETNRSCDEFELATRLSMFLWCSIPDTELLDLATRGRLSDPDVLQAQAERMLSDARSKRFSRHFVRQWLGMQLLDFLDVDKKSYPQFDSDLKEAMQEEPVAFFDYVLKNNCSVMDFIHADYTMVNERLARHYGLNDVYGNHFRYVTFEPEHGRGGLLTQAGLLAMNSDGKDSHPLKRGIWMLENLLNDPPPPPPPAVPEIDLADPEIAKLTLKQRIEDHRNDPACMSCHAKIDPWGIAFENFDAVGSWRTEIQQQPVDASSTLFNGQELDGMDGLKRFLLTNRQDQFARAMVHKLMTYALGRPLAFGDRSGVDRITAEFRKQGDGLATLVSLIVASDLFQSK